ncbi:sialoadhesin-like [Anabas testudineus]|uniref:sialoadhesin-like n=1 Tax=Anabas testudineus TaxID=64144 RepID=UPI000E45858A|nr:sialoadhesin-like [Anabas testudineus]
MEFYDNIKDQHTLRIYDVKKNDSAEYAFTDTTSRQFVLPGVILIVTGLKVTMTPSAVVTEGQTVTLSCTTSCPLTDDTIYTWYMNGRPLTLTESQTKHLILDPVSTEHEGSYFCTVMNSQNISSSEENLTVKARDKSIMILNSVKVALLSILVLTVASLLCLNRKKETMT